ncbi:MAG: electron transfer flavoprotein subunit alpha/FixB family protein [Negativicutes bacterium]|nr:electron transfer flavoprotein subunit alpha/FixB family protein [Negativicutes bacterium]
MGEIWIYSEEPAVAAQLLVPGKKLVQGTAQSIRVILTDKSAAHELIRRGADKVHVFDTQDGRPESCAPVLAEMIQAEKPTAVLFGGTLRGKEVAARCAALVGAGLVTDALDIRMNSGSVETDRMVYGGLAVATELLTEPALIGISPLSYQAPEEDGSRDGDVIIEEVAASSGIVIQEICPIVREGADLANADKIVCIGRGIAKQEDIDMFSKLAELMDAEVGCTRALADSQWLSHEVYLGISGVKAKPSLYLAFGVSGQVQHLSGIRDSKTIVAVDINENAPIFAAADYGIVGDLYEVAPLLIEALQK